MPKKKPKWQRWRDRNPELYRARQRLYQQRLRLLRPVRDALARLDQALKLC